MSAPFRFPGEVHQAGAGGVHIPDFGYSGAIISGAPLQVICGHSDRLALLEVRVELWQQCQHRPAQAVVRLT